MDICEEYLPRPQLRPFVDCVWHSGPTLDTAFEIIPDGCVDACFVLSERRPRVQLFGTTTRTRACELEARTPYFGVRFRPGKASLFIREKIANLTDTQLDVSDFLGLGAEEMLEAGSFVERRTRLESALTRTLSNSPNQAPHTLGLAISVIDSRHGNVRVHELAALCNLSERQLERLFLERVGIMPKLYMRIRRFRSVLNLLEDPVSPERPRLADVAASYGYADQSHMVRDFHDFSHSLSLAN